MIFVRRILCLIPAFVADAVYGFIVIVNDITNFCFRLLQEPYTEAAVRLKRKFLMSLTVEYDKIGWK